MRELKESEKTLLKIVPLAVPNRMPKDFMELHDVVWKAFNLGREYEELRLSEEREEYDKR